MGERSDYKLDHRPLGRGGYAEVYPATRKIDGTRVAFKRIHHETDLEAKARLAREIDVLQKLEHKNIIQLLDFDLGNTWYTMPLALGTLANVKPPIPTEILVKIVDDIINAMEYSFSKGYVHRDITPNNILGMEDHNGKRWVLADWGLVRRPAGQTTARLTTGQIGTLGFIAPEAWSDGHLADRRADIYALGRMAAWARTGQWPIPNIDLLPSDEWLLFVSRAAAMAPNDRPQDASSLRELLQSVRPLEVAVQDDAAEKIARYRQTGDKKLLPEAVDLATRDVADRDLWWDTICELTTEELAIILASSEARFRALLRGMETSLTKSDWRGRDFDHANELIYFFQKCATACVEVDNMLLLAECCTVWFPLDIKWDRWRQADRSRRFLRDLRGQAAEVVARILRSTPKAPEYFAPEPDLRWPDADPRIRAVLNVKR